MKKYLKSILCLILALALVFAVAACGEDDSANDDDEDEEEAKEKDEKDDDEDDKNKSKGNQPIGITKNEKLGEEAVTTFFDLICEFKFNKASYYHSNGLGSDLNSASNVEEYIENISIINNLKYHDVSPDIIDLYREFIIDIFSSFADANKDYEIISVNQMQNSVVKIEYKSLFRFTDSDWPFECEEALDLIDFSLLKFLDNCDNLSESEINAKLESVVSTLSSDFEKDWTEFKKQNPTTHTVYVFEEDGNWLVDVWYDDDDYYYDYEVVLYAETDVESAGDWCDFCDDYTDDLYYYDGWDLCWDCYCDEAYYEEATEAVSSVSGWCDWCDEYDYDLYYWDGDYICEDCWYSF